MATLGLSKVFILDKYFTELQKFWETEKKLQDASSSNEAVHLQQRLRSLSTELVTLRNKLHVQAPPTAPPIKPSLPPVAPGNTGPAPLLYKPIPQHQKAANIVVADVLNEKCPPVPAVGGGGSTPHSPGDAGSKPVTPRAAPVAVSCSAQLDDLIHLPGPLTEDAVLKCLHARFNASQLFLVQKYDTLPSHVTITSQSGVNSV
ncbi:hypothetical protein M8J77_002562 [Diaphorina citri]|nr:hypothetical protein M8J77_002562 [Diaphorina citri]